MTSGASRWLSQSSESDEGFAVRRLSGFLCLVRRGEENQPSSSAPPISQGALLRLVAWVHRHDPDVGALLTKPLL